MLFASVPTRLYIHVLYSYTLPARALNPYIIYIPAAVYIIVYTLLCIVDVRWQQRSHLHDKIVIVFTFSLLCIDGTGKHLYIGAGCSGEDGASYPLYYSNYYLTSTRLSKIYRTQRRRRRYRIYIARLVGIILSGALVCDA